MNRKDGFIATSLIYSFFLAFIAVFTALLASYLANKTVLERFNTDAIEALNKPTYSLNIYAVNANIENGVAFTNLVSESTFESLNYWQTANTNFARITNYDGTQYAIKKENNSSSSKIEQNIYLLNNTKYYLSLRYKNESTGEYDILKSYLENASNVFDSLECKPTTGSWKKTSNIFTTESDDAGMYRLVIGENDFWTSLNAAYFTDIMLINLTDSFGTGHEPNIEWLDKNVDYFAGSVSFITTKGINAGDTRTIRFALFKQGDVDMNKYVLDCGRGTTTGLADVVTINDKDYAEIEIENITKDTTCKIEWTVP